MNILFINQHTGSRTFPLASASLLAAVEAKFGDRVRCSIVELAPGFDPETAAVRIAAAEPDLAALSLYLWSRDALLELARILKTRRPGVTVAAGGPETDGIKTLRKTPGVDLAVPGEGERAIVAVIQALLEGRNPVSVADAGIADPRIFRIDDFDALPSPYTTAFFRNNEHEDMLWELTRGCPFRCHFCYESRGDVRIRQKSFATVSRELALLKTRGVSRVFVLDPTFNYRPERARRILRHLIENGGDMHFSIEVRAEFLEEEQAELFSRLNCSLQIGLQSADPAVTAQIGRPFNPDTFVDKLYLLHQNGVVYGLDLIYGLPGDSLAGFLDSLEFALECAPNHLDVFPLSILPGTRLNETAEGLGLHWQHSAPYQVTGSDRFSSDDLETAGMITNAVEDLYNRCAGVSWFLAVTGHLEISGTELLREYARGNHAVSAAGLADFLRHAAQVFGNPEFGDLYADIAVTHYLRAAGRDLEGFAFRHDAVSLARFMDRGISDIDDLNDLVGF